MEQRTGTVNPPRVPHLFAVGNLSYRGRLRSYGVEADKVHGNP